MIGWNNVEVAKEYRKQMLQEAAQWRLAHQASQQHATRIHHRTLAWLGYRLLLVGIQLLKRSGEAGIISLVEAVPKE